VRSAHLELDAPEAALTLSYIDTPRALASRGRKGLTGPFRYRKIARFESESRISALQRAARAGGGALHDGLDESSAQAPLWERHRAS